MEGRSGTMFSSAMSKGSPTTHHSWCEKGYTQFSTFTITESSKTQCACRQHPIYAKGLKDIFALLPHAPCLEQAHTKIARGFTNPAGAAKAIAP